MNRKYVGIEVGVQMSELVVERLRKVIGGEQGGISSSIGWKGGGSFAMFSFDKTKDGQNHASEGVVPQDGCPFDGHW